MHIALPEAITKGEFFALYQPQVSAADGRVVAAEALLRWERPGVGTVLPGDFVPFAEEHGLIDPIGTFMMQMACRDAVAWKDIRVAVNVSQKQFEQPALAPFICGIAESAGLPLPRLEVEITETSAFADVDRAIAELSALRSRGVVVSLDDFGTGTATLDLMAKLPLDRVKIGRDTVQDIPTNAGAERLRELVAAAHARQLGVTAEGVETKAEYEFLRELGCDLMQGFLFARPMTAKALATFVGAR